MDRVKKRIGFSIKRPRGKRRHRNNSKRRNFPSSNSKLWLLILILFLAIGSVQSREIEPTIKPVKMKRVAALGNGFPLGIRNGEKEGDSFIIQDSAPYSEGEIHFRVMAHIRNEDEAPVLGLVFNFSDEKNYDAVVLSINGAHEGIFYGTVRDGAFNTHERMDVENLKVNQWYKLIVSFDRDQVTVRYLDKLMSAPLADRKQGPGQIGFVVRTSEQEGMFEVIEQNPPPAPLPGKPK